jgi:2-keto-3-deoxy-L-fuconate dehydrogenase
MFNLKNKNAAITGAGSGIGAAIAQTFAQAGAKVYVLDRDMAAAEAVAQSIRQNQHQAEAKCVDITDKQSVVSLALELGCLDILVNNAGIGHVGSLLSTEGEDLDRMYQVNVRGTFNVTKAFVPEMLKAGRGSVINLASIGGVVGVRERLAYCTTKFAVVGMTKTLALDHSGRGVRFNCLCPGRVETPFVQARLKEYADPVAAYQEMSSTQLAGRMARPDEIAAAALYLASDEAQMITGSCLMIDSGWSAGK